MKAVTEFPNFLLNKAVQTKTALDAEGKTPEDVLTALGTAFKLEGEKLTALVNAVGIASKHTGNLKRIMVLRLSEGETNAPAGATKIEELYYVPEILNLTKAAPPQKPEKGNKRGGRGGGGKGGDRKPKESPWGLSPEEKAAKNKKPDTSTPPKT